jgi:hypothetical protein
MNRAVRFGQTRQIAGKTHAGAVRRTTSDLHDAGIWSHPASPLHSCLPFS